MSEQVTPEQIIKAFDDVLVYIFGPQYGRDNPFKEDKKTAASWIDAGCDLTTATIVFVEQIRWMHEKQSHIGDVEDRTHVPRALKVFEENISGAIWKKTYGAIDTWEAEESRWRARVNGWLRKPTSWNADMWGATPDDKNCRAPKKLISEMLSKILAS